MKRRPIHLATMMLAVLTCAAAPALAAPDVGVTVHVSQPGVYGRVDIGNVPPPALVYAQPIVVQPPPRVVAVPQPVYLWVPPGHQKHWSKHCGRYGACGVPVYFVQDRWYREHVQSQRGAPPQGYGQPVYAGGRGGPPGPGYGYAADRDDRWKDDDGKHGRGHGHGKEKDKDKDKDKDKGHGHGGRGD